MQTITINLINPKAKKLINSLADLGLISINGEMSASAKWHEDKEFVASLEKEIELYKQGKLKTYSKEEVFDMISKRKKKNTKEKIVK